MGRASAVTPGISAEKVWKRRHSGVLVMLTKGAKDDGTLSHELIENAKVKYSYRSARTIRRLWAKYKPAIIAGEGFKLTRKEGSGRNFKHSVENLKELIRAVPKHQRKTLRSLSHASGIKKCTL